MVTTRWADKVTASFDTALSLLLDKVKPEEKEINISLENWDIQKVLEENQSIILNGRNIQYNMLKGSYDQISSGDQPLEDRTVHKSIIIIPYYNGISVNYIIDQHTSAQKILRRLLSYTGKNEIQKNVYNFSNDFFIWLVSKVYNSDNIIEANNVYLSNLQLIAIKGFRGDTEDLQTRVSATGESVMNIISTLSFLLESSRLSKIIVDLCYSEHENISLILKKDSISIDLNSYIGSFENEAYDIKMAKLYLLVYLEILPLLEQEYQSDISNNNWNRETYIDFMNNVAENLTKRIKEKINMLNDDS